jgi:hypothetical protein
MRGTWICAAATALGVAAAPAAANVDAGSARLLTEMVTVALADTGRFDVLSSADVQQALALEAEKQALGCSARDCLAEIAGAMGARMVVFGQVGRLGEAYLLTLNVFDSEAATSVARAVAEAENIDGLRKQVTPTVQELLAKITLPESAERPKLLVLDLSVSGAEVEPAPEPAPAFPVLLVAGGATAVAGVAAVATGGVLGYFAQQEHDKTLDGELPQAAAIAAYDARDGLALSATVVVIAGAVLAVGGGTLAAVGLLTGGAE